MAIVVVGGSGRGVGKTALVCGVIAALPDLEWIAVKITGDAHTPEQPIWEESTAGKDTDTARYLAAGARRAFLLTAADSIAMQTALDELGQRAPRKANFIFESNRILDFVKSDACLMVDRAAAFTDAKTSFEQAMKRADAIVMHAQAGELPARIDEKPVFYVEQFERLPVELAAWIRGLLIYR